MSPALTIADSFCALALATIKSRQQTDKMRFDFTGSTFLMSVVAIAAQFIVAISDAETESDTINKIEIADDQCDIEYVGI